MSEPVEVARFQWRHEAEMVRGILADEGIEAVVLADDVGGAYAGIGAARLLVAADEAERARAVIEEMEADREAAEE